MASGERSAFGKNPTAGLAAIMSAKSCSSSRVRMTLGQAWELVRWTARRAPIRFRRPGHVDQRDIRAQFFHSPDCLSDCRGDPDNRDFAALKQSRGYFNKHWVVINNYAPQLLCSRRHHSSFAYGRGGAIPASCKPWTILGALGSQCEPH